VKPVKDPPKNDSSLGAGPLARLNDPPNRGIEVAGAGLSLFWIILILVYVLIAPPGSETRSLGLVVTSLMVFLPIALIGTFGVMVVAGITGNMGTIGSNVNAFLSSQTITTTF